MQRGVGRRVHWIALSCLTETIRLGALPLNCPDLAPPKGRGVLRETAAGSARWRRGATLARFAHPGPALYCPSPNGFELTGAGLAPGCLNDNGAAGVRCSEGLGEAFTE